MSGVAQPFPPVPVRKQTTGVSITAQELAVELGLDPDVDAELRVATRLREVAGQYAERYAPQAPASMLDESVIRFSAYMHSTQDTLGWRKIGLIEAEPVSNHAASFRNSGAAMLLSPWRIRRAGRI